MTDRLDNETLRAMAAHAREAQDNDVYYEVAPNAFLAVIAELTELRAQAGGWASPLERMPKVGDSVVAIGLEDEPLAGKVGPHWHTADDLLLNTATGEGYSFEHVALWMLLPTPPEAT